MKSNNIWYPPPFFNVQYTYAANIIEPGQHVADLYLYLPAISYSGKLAPTYISNEKLLGVVLDSNWGHITTDYDLSQIPIAYKNQKYRFLVRQYWGKNWEDVISQVESAKTEIIKIVKSVKKPEDYMEVIE